MSRRHRPSITSPPLASPSSGPSAGAADDISALTLAEVRDRLARNARVLNISIISAPSPQSGVGAGAGAGAGAGSTTSPGLRSPTLNQGWTVPVTSPPSGQSTAKSSSQTQLPSSASYPSATPITPGGSISVPVSFPVPTRSPHSNSHFNSTTPTPTPAGGARYGTHSLGTSPTDSVRDRLLAARSALLQREKELLAAEAATAGLGGLHLDPAGDGGSGAESSDMARRRSAGASTGASVGPASPVGTLGRDGRDAREGAGMATSGKRAALMDIRERERWYPANGLILPVSESIALVSRDFDTATAHQLSTLAISPTQSSSPKSRRPKHLGYPESPSAPGPHQRVTRVNGDDAPSALHRDKDKGKSVQGAYDPDDEIARANYLARMNAFMGYKSRSRGEGEGDDARAGADGFARADRDKGHGGGAGLDEDVDAMFDFEEQADYLGDDGYMDGAGGESRRREPGTGEVVDQWGEDDERWAEGNGDYELGGGEVKEEMDM